jgi:hypothetical protein
MAQRAYASRFGAGGGFAIVDVPTMTPVRRRPRGRCRARTRELD